MAKNSFVAEVTFNPGFKNFKLVLLAIQKTFLIMNNLP